VRSYQTAASCPAAMDAFRGELEARRSLLERDVVVGLFDGAGVGGRLPLQQRHGVFRATRCVLETRTSPS
jgi:hypothetical protein